MNDRREFPRPTRETARTLAWIAQTPVINNSVTPLWYSEGNNESKEVQS